MDLKEANQKVLSEVILNRMDSVSEFNNLTVMITRGDGVTLWANSDSAKKDHSLGALITGLWSSAKALTDIFDAENINNHLTYGGSSDGVHILPMTLSGKPYAFSVIFKDVLNPSKLKLKFRLFKTLIENDYEEKISFAETIDTGKEKTKNLFNNITDEEIDNLFAL